MKKIIFACVHKRVGHKWPLPFSIRQSDPNVARFEFCTRQPVNRCKIHFAQRGFLHTPEHDWLTLKPRSLIVSERNSFGLQEERRERVLTLVRYNSAGPEGLAIEHGPDVKALYPMGRKPRHFSVKDNHSLPATALRFAVLLREAGLLLCQ
jgi:hypothetical protein